MRTVVIQHDRTLVREGLAEVLARQDDLKVVATIAHQDDLADLTAAHRPDVVVRRRGPKDRLHAAQAINVDIDDSMSLDMVIAAVRAEAGYAAPQMERRKVRGPALTKREFEVLTAIARGRSTKQIADDLGLSAKTVDNHKQRIFAKLGVQSQGHAVSVALDHGIINASRRRREDRP